MAYTSIAIANAFLNLAVRDGKQLSNMKLQKLLYFAQGHCLSLRGTPLIKGDAAAWDYGPVYERVYHQFKKFGAKPIPGPARHPSCRESEVDESDWAAPQDPETLEFIEAVWNSYSDLTAIRLSEMSHVANGPWAQAYKESRGSTITKESIKSYFDSLGGA